MATENLSQADQEFLVQMEEELKNRYTEKDENFMKVFTSEPSVPPIMENWYTPAARGNNFRRYNPYDRPNNRDRGNYDRDNGYHGNRRRDHGRYSDYNRGYNDYENYGHSSNRRRY